MVCCREEASACALSGTVTWTGPLPTASHATPSSCWTGGTTSGEGAGVGTLLSLGVSISLKGAAGQMGPGKPAMPMLSPAGCRDVWLSPVCLCRTASYYWDSKRQHYRSLLKLYGIRFDISVHGQVACPHTPLPCHCLQRSSCSSTASLWAPGSPLPSLCLLSSTPCFHQAGKFGIIPAAVSFGTGIAFLGTVSTEDALFL